MRCVIFSPAVVTSFYFFFLFLFLSDHTVAVLRWLLQVNDIEITGNSPYGEQMLFRHNKFSTIDHEITSRHLERAT